MPEADRKDKAKDEPKAAKKKRQSKRDIVILEETGAPQGVASYEAVCDGFASATDARKWIRGEGKKLEGKILIIASMTQPKKVMVETKEVTKF